jgi:acylphosphatase
MTRTVKILVTGRVQGVYFRKFTKSKASAFGIYGTVKNTVDGRVEIIAQANSDKLDPFIRWCHKGPITARVDQVDISDLNNQEEYKKFDII